MSRYYHEDRRGRGRRSEKNSSCCVNLIWTVIFIVVAAVVFEKLTGQELPIFGKPVGDAIDKLPDLDVGNIGESIGDAIGDAVENLPDLNVGDAVNNIRDNIPKFNLTGLIDRINIPDFGFDVDDIFSFDDGNIFGGNYTGVPPGKMIGWKSKNGQGLKLHIANALTDDWHYYFNKAIADWENGSPDVITLETSIAKVDPECKPESGIMKVCNADYGNTGWKGINEMLISGDYVVASVAKMNEYYVGETVKNASKERQYTMCHEIGHGFGLPHLDENFYNTDLNSCMDYSSRPQNNQQPSQADFNSLNTLYGGNEDVIAKNSFWGQRRNLRQNKYYNHNGKFMEKRVYYIPA